jgi:hypothetical protein
MPSTWLSTHCAISSFLAQRLLQRAGEIDAHLLAQREHRFVGGNLEILEGVVGERVL